MVGALNESFGVALCIFSMRILVLQETIKGIEDFECQDAGSVCGRDYDLSGHCLGRLFAIPFLAPAHRISAYQSP